MAPGTESGSLLAVVADVGRTAVRIALTDERGLLRKDTVETFDPSRESTVSGALTAYARGRSLPSLPRRCAVAVSGAPVGDVISITNSRWFVSRSGLQAMLKAPPLILNDFAANGWAVSAQGPVAAADLLGGQGLDPSKPGTYCLIGIGSGLGVAVIARDEAGNVQVLPTEAGHCQFMGEVPGVGTLLAAMRKDHGHVSAEGLISARGLMAIYRTLSALESAPVRAEDARDVVRRALGPSDPLASRAVDYMVRSLWHFAANMTLAYGAWDGVIVTGSVAHALSARLRLPQLADTFQLAGPYHRLLRQVPRALLRLDQGELAGAAHALLKHRPH